MLERFWDLFVDTLIVLFLPLVCSYFTFQGSLFFNVSAKNATGLEYLGNQVLAPLQYVFAGREASQKGDGTWEFTQRFEYKSHFWTKATLSVLSLPSSAVLGATVKGLSYLSSATRARHDSLFSSLKSTTIEPQIGHYQKLGLSISEALPEAFVSENHYARGPKDAEHLAIEKKALQEIGTLLTEAKIPWWVDCGTCLGVYRYGGVIPWDFDIDVAVLQPDFDNVLHTLNRLDQEKYTIQDWSSRELPKSYIKVFIRESSSLIDIYCFKICPETKQISYIFSLENALFFPDWWKIREQRFKEPIAIDSVFPLKRAQFDGIDVFVPNDIKKYLQRYYGENLAPAKIYDPITGRFEKDENHPYWQRTYAH